MKSRIQYFEGRTFIHRMHPIVKVIWLMVLSISLLILPSPWFILGFLTLLALGFWYAGAGKIQLAGIRLILLTSLLLAGFQFVFIQSGQIWLQIGSLEFTRDGLFSGIYIGGRFMGIVLLSYLFVLTTHPGELVYALMRVGVPYRYGYTLITALRMVPLFQIEADTIYKAQIARGMGLDHGGLRGLFTRVRQLLMPLLVSALGKADILAVSMEGRGFGMYPQRTYLRSAALRSVDVWSLIGLVLWVLSTSILRVVWI
jgi:energy-coupling factor transport system permease protein